MTLKRLHRIQNFWNIVKKIFLAGRIVGQICPTTKKAPALLQVPYFLLVGVPKGI